MASYIRAMIKNDDKCEELYKEVRDSYSKVFIEVHD